MITNLHNITGFERHTGNQQRTLSNQEHHPSELF